ncbi:MAG: hypothetical protein O9302_06985 [Cyclobacteriaceae bacterium]|jgi:hypothetical protein|nr:hypothetical protein [Cytophagales bacterium]MCZ8327785.1 hypothetical protein [Cyclobacteriaceae bacterium]
MKSILTILLFVLMNQSVLLLAQVKAVNASANKLDSVSRSFLKRDSIERAKLKLLYQNSKDSISKSRNKIVNKIDSVNAKSRISLSVGLPDSLTKKGDTLKILNAKLDSLNLKFKHKSDSINSRLNKVKIKASSYDLKKSENLPNTNVRIDNSVEFVPNNLKLPGTNLNSRDYNHLNGSNKITENLNEVKEIKDKSNQFKNAIPKIDSSFFKVDSTYLKPDSILKEKTNEIIDDKLNKVEEFETLNKNQRELDAHQKKLEEFKKINPTTGKELKEKKINQSKNKIEDLTKEQEALVSNELVKMGKLMKKFPSLDDTRNIPKFRPNLMKGKPFRDRALIGVRLVSFTRNNKYKSLQINPYLDYFITDRLRLGTGFVFETWFTDNLEEVTLRNDIYGIRQVVSYKLKHGVYAYFEPEILYSPKLQAVVNNQQDEDYSWERRYNIGLYKTYFISRKIDGTMTALYDINNVGKTLRINQFELRFGFELKLKKIKKPFSDLRI